MQTISRCVRVALALAVLALAGGLAGGQPPNRYREPPAPAPDKTLPSDLQLIPDDAAGFIALHPVALFDKVLNKDARKLKELVKTFEEQSGLNLTDIERLTVAFVGD